MYNEYDGNTYYPKYSEDLVHTEVMLPENAPKEYEDASVLWNSVEMIEKSSDAQLARTYKVEFKYLSTTWKKYNCGGYPMEEQRNVFSDEVAIKIVDSVKEIILELIKRTLPANPQIEQK